MVDKPVLEIILSFTASQESMRLCVPFFHPLTLFVRRAQDNSIRLRNFLYTGRSSYRKSDSCLLYCSAFSPNRLAILCSLPSFSCPVFPDSGHSDLIFKTGILLIPFPQARSFSWLIRGFPSAERLPGQLPELCAPIPAWFLPLCHLVFCTHPHCFPPISASSVCERRKCP